MSLFTIPKNAHYASPRLGFMGFKSYDGRNTMKGTFRLSKSMWYDTATYGTHINKLCGFSTDIFSDNSTRIGWRPHETPFAFEMYAYLHINGVWVRNAKFKDDLINVCYADQDYDWEIGFYQPEINRLRIGAGTVERHYPGAIGKGWVQEFYYGGKPKSPQVMSAIISGKEYDF